MSRCCEFTGKSVMVGNNVSHANNKTKRRFIPNLQSCRFFSDHYQRFFRFRVSVHAIRCVDKAGGLDNFLLNTKKANLSPEAITLKQKLTKETAPQTAEAA